MTRSLNGKVAVITGAGSGMGRSMALRLAAAAPLLWRKALPAEGERRRVAGGG